MEYSKVADQLGDWAPKMKEFIESSKFDDIFKFLKAERRDGKVICPEHHNVFRAFRETPYKDLRCVFLLQDPYPWIKFKDGEKVYVADGLAMSCSNTGQCQPSLDLFYDGMEDDLGVHVPHHPDLSYLARQGILFLNTSLTVEEKKPTSHKGLWDTFMDHLINEAINYYNRGLVYVSFGKNAHYMARAIVPFLHYGFEVEHPAAAAHSKRTWDHQNIFTKINKVLKENNDHQIKWTYDG